MKVSGHVKSAVDTSKVCSSETLSCVEYPLKTVVVTVPFIDLARTACTPRAVCSACGNFFLK